MVVVVMMVMMPIARDDDDAVAVRMMMVVVMVVITADADNDLGQLEVRVRGLGRSGFVDGLQQFGRVRDGFEQVGEGIRPHDVCRGRSWRRSGLSGVHCPERRHRSQKSSYLLIHKFSSNEHCAYRNAADPGWFRHRCRAGRL
jgi:hypothetical protein